MYVLLSSGAQKRYRDDILRCMAAPMGAVLQFRYNETIVGQSILLDLAAMKGQKGLVCNLDVEQVLGSNGEHHVIPVRHVVIEKVWYTGSTISVAFRVGAFAVTDALDRFTQTFYASPHPPRNVAKSAEKGAFWFFQAAVSLDENLSSSNDLRDWEGIAKHLIAIDQFHREPFFWTVLGLNKGFADDLEIDSTFRIWPDKIQCDHIYTLLLYVFRPSFSESSNEDEIERTGWSGQLLINSDPPISSHSGSVIAVDSPYDLKRWTFQIKRPHLTFRDGGQLRIGEEALDKSDLHPCEPSRTAAQIRKELRELLKGNAQWEIELPLTFNSPWPRVIGVSSALGLLLALPALISITQQPATPGNHPITASIGALIAGYLAAIIAVFQIKKPT